MTEEEIIKKTSQLTTKDKQGELLRMIMFFSKNMIDSLDKNIKNLKPKIIEYEFIDLLAESIFSIRSFCLLMKDGLISSASAIMRVIIEQVSIVSAASLDNNARKAFLNVKHDKNKYFAGNNEFRKAFAKQIALEKGITRKIKQYFDYGFCVKDGKPIVDLEQLCEVVGFKEAYAVIGDVINGFSHGQISFFKITRSNKNIAQKYIDNLFRLLGLTFFRLTNIFISEYGKDAFTANEIKTIDMAFAISCNLDSRFLETTLLDSINLNKLLVTREIPKNIATLSTVLSKCINSNDIREHYLLSQTYISFLKQVFAGAVRSMYPTNNQEAINSLGMNEILVKCNPVAIIDGYKDKTNRDIHELAEYVDSRDICWTLSSCDAIYLQLIDSLLNVLKDKCKNVELIL